MMLELPVRSTTSQLFGNGAFRACVSESQGMRPTQEDAYFVTATETRLCIGVLDGHGGAHVARRASTILPRQMMSREALDESLFLHVDDLIRNELEDVAAMQAERLALCKRISVLQRTLKRMQPLHDRYMRQATKLGTFMTPERRKKNTQLAMDRNRLHDRYVRDYVIHFTNRAQQPNWGVHAREEEALLDAKLQMYKKQVNTHDTLTEWFIDTHTGPYMHHVDRVRHELQMCEAQLRLTYAGKERSGCTAVVADISLVQGSSPADGKQAKTNSVRIAHAGDSRALLYNRHGVLLHATNDHTPSDTVERARIFAAGGTITNTGGCERVNYNLNMTRALGDFKEKLWVLHPATHHPITAAPTVSDQYNLAEGDFLVLVCDGIFEQNFFTNETLGEAIVSRKDYVTNPESATLHVLALCAEKVTNDNQTIMIVTFPYESTAASSAAATVAAIIQPEPSINASSYSSSSSSSSSSSPIPSATLVDVRYDGESVLFYRPMAIQDPNTTFLGFGFAWISVRAKSRILDVLRDEFRTHHLTMREGLLLGFKYEPPNTVDAHLLMHFLQETHEDIGDEELLSLIHVHIRAVSLGMIV